jgi:hypothetical protein
MRHAIHMGQPDRVQALVLTGKPALEVLEPKGAFAYLQDWPDKRRHPTPPVNADPAIHQHRDTADRAATRTLLHPE